MKFSYDFYNLVWGQINQYMVIVYCEQWGEGKKFFLEGSAENGILFGLIYDFSF